MTSRTLPLVWKDGRRVPATEEEFAHQLRIYADYADAHLSSHSNFLAHLGERMRAAADLIDDLRKR